MTPDSKHGRCPECGRYHAETLPDTGRYICPTHGPYTDETASHIAGGQAL